VGKLNGPIQAVYQIYDIFFGMGYHHRNPHKTGISTKLKKYIYKKYTMLSFTQQTRISSIAFLYFDFSTFTGNCKESMR